MSGKKKYKRGKVFAKGGMGEVLSAEDTTLERSVAMKVMLDRSSGSKAARMRFIQEARIMGHLEHPNIVPVHELATAEDGSVY